MLVATADHPLLMALHTSYRATREMTSTYPLKFMLANRPSDLSCRNPPLVSYASGWLCVVAAPERDKEGVLTLNALKGKMGEEQCDHRSKAALMDSGGDPYYLPGKPQTCMEASSASFRSSGTLTPGGPLTVPVPISLWPRRGYRHQVL